RRRRPPRRTERHAGVPRWHLAAAGRVAAVDIFRRTMRPRLHRDRLAALVDGFAGRPVPMAVDLVADRFVTGTPKRISREAPVLILQYEGEHLAPGGGANAVANVAALDGRPLPLGVVGDDASGTELVAALAARGVDVSGVRVRSGYRTPTKVRIVGGARHALKQQIVRYDVEDRVALDDADRAAFAAALERWTAAGAAPAVAILSDYGYGGADPSLVPLLRGALGAGAALVCDSRWRLADLAASGGVDGATPNEEEAEALHGGPLAADGDDAALAAAGEALRRRLGARFLLVTRGSRGMSLFEEGGAAHLPVHGTDQVADVTGAGDTVIGTFALALAAGAEPLEAAALANYAGGVVVMKMGTATLSRDELRHAIDSDPRPLEEMTSTREGGWARS
ncbi:MAG TPA: PfkB family carbohydrate kinase, partial [Thermoanaerobaculia bacterium]|nr:PfkB family carbohydrate kinase [Thermoanaerobaculia bacterium]